MENPVKAKKFYKIALKLRHQCRNKILLFQQKSRRLRKQIKTFKGVLKHLKQTNRLSEESYSILQVCYCLFCIK